MSHVHNNVCEIDPQTHACKSPIFTSTQNISTEGGYTILPYEHEGAPIHGKGFRGDWRQYVVQVKTFEALQRELTELQSERYGFNTIDVLAPTKCQETECKSFVLLGRLNWNGKDWKQSQT